MHVSCHNRALCLFPLHLLYLYCGFPNPFLQLAAVGNHGFDSYNQMKVHHDTKEYAHRLDTPNGLPIFVDYVRS